MKEVLMYTTRTCGDCQLARSVLTRLSVEYREIDVADDDARERVLELNGGYATVPTLILPSGRVLREPTAPELSQALSDEGLARS